MLPFKIDHPVVEKLVGALITIKITADGAPGHMPFVKSFSKKAEDALAPYREARDKLAGQKVRSSAELIGRLEDLVKSFDTAALLVKLSGDDSEAACFKLDQQILREIIAELKVHHGLP